MKASENMYLPIGIITSSSAFSTEGVSNPFNFLLTFGSALSPAVEIQSNIFDCDMRVSAFPMKGTLNPAFSAWTKSPPYFFHSISALWRSSMAVVSPNIATFFPGSLNILTPGALETIVLIPTYAGRIKKNGAVNAASVTASSAALNRRCDSPGRLIPSAPKVSASGIAFEISCARTSSDASR